MEGDAQVLKLGTTAKMAPPKLTVSAVRTASCCTSSPLGNITLSLTVLTVRPHHCQYCCSMPSCRCSAAAEVANSTIQPHAAAGAPCYRCLQALADRGLTLHRCQHLCPH